MKFKNTITKILRRKSQNTVDTHRFQIMLRERFPQGAPFSFVQIGANDGVKFDDLFSFVTTRKSRGLVVEPLKYYFKKLVENYKNFPDVVPIKCAIHATERTARIHYVDPEKLGILPEWSEGIGSLNPNHHKESNTPSEHMISQKVDCMTLMELLDKHFPREIDLLQIDAEGYDDKIVRMIDFNSVKPKFIKYEHASISKPDKTELIELLKLQGYDSFQQKTDTIAFIP